MGVPPLSNLTEEERSFLQQRIAMFGFITGGMMLLGYVLRLGIIVMTGGSLDLAEPSLLFHLLIAAPLLTAWLLCRRRPRTARVAIAIQAFALLGAAACLLVMGAYIPIQARPEVIVTFALALVLLARAIYVPTPWQVTMAQCIVLGIALIATSYRYYSHLPADVLALLNPMDDDVAAAAPDYASLFAVVTAVWWTLASILCVGATQVIYGLRQQVADVRKLGQYTLQRKLGEGGMGIVYEASHAMLARPTAVKLLTPDKTSERSVARFEREVQHTARLTHPNTITVFDYGRTPDGLFYYAMELLDGATLSDVVALSGCQEASRTIHVMMAAAGALAEAHGVGLTHRDIKPANIMLCDRGGIPDTVKVLDFGLVKELHPAGADASLTNVAEVKGTPLYMSPESIATPEQVGARSDLYALGAVGYFLLTGTHVFEADSVVEVCSHHLHTPPERPSRRLGATIDPGLERIIMQCLEKAPDDRPTSAEELRYALAECVVPTWTDELARSWWARYAGELRTLRSESISTATAHTIAIDLEQRRRATRSVVFSTTGGGATRRRASP